MISDNQLLNKDLWFLIFSELKEKNFRQRKKLKAYEEIINSGAYLNIAKAVISHEYTFKPPKKVHLNKLNTGKKKIIYIFNYQDDFVLKVINKILTENYSDLISKSCHSFQSNKSSKTAFKSILRDRSIKQKYALKTDISNYFNSVNIPNFWQQLPNQIKQDKTIMFVLEQVLNNTKSVYKGCIIDEPKGLMAGTAIAPFLSNIYLKTIDDFFVNQQVTYARYSDDIIIFDTKENIKKHLDYILSTFKDFNLQLNKEKTKVVNPGEEWSFLGFKYNNGKIDISEVTVNKLKRKIKRLSNRYYKLYKTGEYTENQILQFFINKLNRKFYGKNNDVNTLCWSKWFFPLINTDHTLNYIDKFIQDKLRYSVCGRYRKLNYKKIPYSRLKSLEYKPLKSYYYLFKYDFEKFNRFIQF